jgi:soluble lytic murein transglycosylase-like protein
MFAGKKIWVSELASIAIICVLLAALLSVSLVIIRNERAIHDADRRIAELRAEKINLARDIEAMREKDRLIKLMNAVVGGKTTPATVQKLADLVYKNSRQYGYAPELLLAVIAVESHFNPEALGRYRSGTLSGALGLMQIKYVTARTMANMLGMEGIEPDDLLDPEINMILGTAYLTTLVSRFKSFKLGLLAYNLGPTTVRGSLARNEKLPMRYYEKVLAQYYKLKALGVETAED